jgi:acetyltransferase-like isoleucine patch superfamily enzyme
VDRADFNLQFGWPRNDSVDPALSARNSALTLARSATLEEILDGSYGSGRCHQGGCFILFHMGGSGLRFRHMGSNVTVYKLAIILSPENVTLGSDIIIDDFVFIGSHRRLVLGNRVHISSHSSITGGGRVLLSDFSGMGSGARLISGTDDFTDGRLNGSAIPAEFRETHRGTIILEPHAIIGTNAVVLPDVTIGEGATVGAGSVVTRSLEPWGVYAGSPARKIKTRPRDIVLANEQRLFEKYGRPEVQYRRAACLEEL